MAYNAVSDFLWINSDSAQLFGYFWRRSHEDWTTYSEVGSVLGWTSHRVRNAGGPLIGQLLEFQRSKDQRQMLVRIIPVARDLTLGLQLYRRRPEILLAALTAVHAAEDESSLDALIRVLARDNLPLLKTPLTDQPYDFSWLANPAARVALLVLHSPRPLLPSDISRRLAYHRPLGQLFEQAPGLLEFVHRRRALRSNRMPGLEYLPADGWQHRVGEHPEVRVGLLALAHAQALGTTASPLQASVRVLLDGLSQD